MRLTPYNQSRPDAHPAREQNLFISISKHLHCLKDQTLKYQSTPIDPRIPGKSLLVRLILLDVDTGVFYGEFQENDDADLLGFLARAWSDKADHPMRGFPDVLNLPRAINSSTVYIEALHYIQAAAPLDFGEMPSGFKAGIHAVKQFEKQVIETMWLDGQPIALGVAQALSASHSKMACWGARSWNDAWSQVPSLTPDILAHFDAAYDPVGAWRKDRYEHVLNNDFHNL